MFWTHHFRFDGRSEYRSPPNEQVSFMYSNRTKTFLTYWGLIPGLLLWILYTRRAFFCSATKPTHVLSGFPALSKYRQSNCHQVPHLLAVCPIHLLRTPSTANLFNNETGHGFSNELLINRFNDLTKLEASRWRRSQIQIQMQTFTAAANPKTVLGRFNTKTSTNFCRFLTNWSDSTQWICIF